MVTRLQSASSSSAATCGSVVRIPVPISDRWVTMKTVPSGRMPRYTLGFNAADSACVRKTCCCANSEGDTTFEASTNAPVVARPPRK
jgi:hypothetical protein